MKVRFVVLFLLFGPFNTMSQILEEYDSILNYLNTCSKIEYRFHQINKLTVLRVDTIRKFIPDNDIKDGFDNSFDVKEIWHFLSLKGDIAFDKSLIISLDSVELHLPLDAFYTKEKKWYHYDRKANKLLRTFIREKLMNSDSLYFSDIKNFAEKHSFKYGLDDMVHDIQKQILLGEVIIRNHDSIRQNRILASLYITPFSEGINYYLLNNEDKIAFLHVNYLMR